MLFRSKFDTVTLKQIRQIPGVTGVITTLYDAAPGEVWSRERIHAPKYVVTLDELAAGNVNGVKIVHLADFLLSHEY